MKLTNILLSIIAACLIVITLTLLGVIDKTVDVNIKDADATVDVDVISLPTRD